MIQLRVQNLIFVKYLCLFAGIWLLLSTSLIAQNRNASRHKIVADTLVRYDTIYVIDTIKIYKSAGRNHLKTQVPVLSTDRDNLVKLQTDEKYLIISSGLAATISRNYIIDSVNITYIKKTETMKKVSFLGVVLFAFQSMVLAQNNISLNFGTGVYQNHDLSAVSSKPAPLFLAGISYRKNFSQNKFSLNTGLNYHFLQPSKFEDLGSFQSANPIYIEEVYLTNYHMFTLPVTLNWNNGWVNPCIGVEYYFKMAPKIKETFTDVAGNQVIQESVVAYNGVSLIAGLEVPVSSRARIELNGFQGLIAEHADQIGGGIYYLKMRRVEIGLKYLLK